LSEDPFGFPPADVMNHAFPVRGQAVRLSRPPWARSLPTTVEPARLGQSPVMPAAPSPASPPGLVDEPEPFEQGLELSMERASSRPSPRRLTPSASVRPASLRPSMAPAPTQPEPSKVTMDENQLRALKEAAEALLRARAQVLSDVESELLELAVDMATVLVEDELASRPELHRALVRAAVGTIEPGAQLKVRASRATYEALLEAFDSSVVETGRGRVQVELDDTLDGLGAVVSAGGATVDGRVHRRLETLRRALIDARRSRDAA
jgi:vacuolar-type H+-ATPase subunit E/Vma4